MLRRRGFISAIAAVLVAPAIVRAESLMPVKVLPTKFLLSTPFFVPFPYNGILVEMRTIISKHMGISADDIDPLLNTIVFSAENQMRFVADGNGTSKTVQKVHKIGTEFVHKSIKGLNINASAIVSGLESGKPQIELFDSIGVELRGLQRI
jgi:hypothetical protein